jgi:hypothetical protein
MRSFAGVFVLLAAGAALMPPHLSAQASGGRATSAAVDTVLSATATYLEHYEQQFSALVAEEQYEQSTRPIRNGNYVFTPPANRELRSDLMVLNLGAAEWVQFRDVYDVDNRPVRDHEARLQKLFEQPASDALGQAQRIANESAHYNVGVARNINVPTMALSYLSRARQGRSVFEVAGSEVVGGASATIVRFREVAVPSLITTQAGSVTTSGRFWLEPSGAVRRTELTCVVPRPWALVGKTTVDYAMVAGVAIMVPVVMDEEYQRDSEVDRGHATYSHFRTFTVDTQSMKRAGGG